MAVIPARYAASRFPGKPLVNETGRFLIQHVYQQVQRAHRIERVIVATDDRRIADAVASFGGDAVMTRADHVSGTDRVAEVAQGLECDLVINVQGDEPEIDPGQLDRLIEIMEQDDGCPMGTLACPFSAVPGADPSDPAAVKVVLDRRGRAIYFSRSQIPFVRDDAGKMPTQPLLHLGVYAYRREFLLQLAALKPTPLEQSESLEQLRVLEHGYEIAVAVVDKACVGIDTPEDYAAFVKRFASGPSGRPVESKYAR